MVPKMIDLVESWKNFLIFNKGMSLQLMIRYSDGDGGDIIMDGFTASIGNDAERAYAFGFLWAGYCSFFGGTLQYYIRKEQKPVPCSWGIACCWCRL